MLANDLGESKITVVRLHLLEKIEQNLLQHKKDFDEAVIGFKAAARAKMQENLQKFDETGKVELTLGLTAPVQHVKDYERVILVLQMSTSDEIVITEDQFTKFVMDDWSWKAAFVGTSALYKNS